MNWIKILKELSLIIISSLFAFLLVEASFRIYLNIKDKDVYSSKTMLFEQGENFRNFDNFFTYFPNKNIRTVAIYSKREPSKLEDAVIEYDYVIETNNLGLVMKRNVLYGQNSTFVIGDSFTEGQGAKPWFYDLEEEYSSDSQIINLGILGTGPSQWLALAKHIKESNNLTINGMVVNIILPDLGRNPWTFTETELICLQDSICPYKSSFQGFDFSKYKNNEEILLSVIKNLKNPLPIKRPNKSNNLLSRIKMFLKKSKVLLSVYSLIGQSLGILPDEQENNQRALMELKQLANENIFLNVVSTKTLTSKNFSSYDDGYTSFFSFIEEQGIKHQWCDIPKEGFLVNDDHPNQYGYKTLRICTKNALVNLDSLTNKKFSK